MDGFDIIYISLRSDSESEPNTITFLPLIILYFLSSLCTKLSSLVLDSLIELISDSLLTTWIVYYFEAFWLNSYTGYLVVS